MLAKFRVESCCYFLISSLLHPQNPHFFVPVFLSQNMTDYLNPKKKNMTESKTEDFVRIPNRLSKITKPTKTKLDPPDPT